MTDDTHDAAARRRNIETIHPIAPLQEGILFHILMSAEKGIYMPQMAYHLSGPIDAARLRAAWEDIVMRHSALRSAIHWEERADPFQVVYRKLRLPWEKLDWHGKDPQSELQRLFTRNRSMPFDLRRPPLMRLQLAKVAKDQHILVLCHHHIILDGWSTARMLQDVMAIYHGKGAGLPPARPYGDYIRWLKQQDRDAALDFWRAYVADTPGPSLAFGGAADAPEFDRQEWVFPATLADRVTRFCADIGVTFNTLLQGVLGLYVAEKLGRSDVFFGSATAGRPANLPGAAAMVGLFINALPVRIRLDPAQPVAVWLTELQRQQAATIDHEQVALRDIQSGLGTLFDCLLVVENYPVTVGESNGDIVLDRVEFDEWTHFPLTLLVAPGHAGMKLILRRDRSVVDDDALSAFTDRYIELLRQVTETPGVLIQNLIGPLEDARPAKTEAPRPTNSLRRAPETETEHLLAEIWAEVLGCNTPNATDNFFAIGGHSLLAAKVIARLRRHAPEADLPVRAMFDRPILADLALYLDALRVGEERLAEGDIVVEF